MSDNKKVKVAICPICGAKNIIKENNGLVSSKDICIHFKHLSYVENEYNGDMELDEIMFTPIVSSIRVKLLDENVDVDKIKGDEDNDN